MQLSTGCSGVKTPGLRVAAKRYQLLKKTKDEDNDY